MEKNNQYLGTEPLGKLLFKLAVPSVVAQIINMLYNIVDRIYIGHMPEGGSLALTGLGVCMPIIMVVSAFAALVSMGGTPRHPSPWAAATTAPQSAYSATALYCR